MRLRAGLIAAAMVLAGCAAEPQAPTPPASARPMRIVSLDYCADQYLLKLVPPARILALSPDAARDFSYMRSAARGLRRVRPNAEDVLALQPDLVIRAYGGGPGAAALFARAGVPVLQLDFADDMPGIRKALVSAGQGLHAEPAAHALDAEIAARLAALPAPGAGPTALYLTPGGVTTGPGNLIHEMLRLAGLRNFVARTGWQPLPLEDLAHAEPAMVAAASFNASPAGPWSAARHPVSRNLMASRPVASLEGAWTACGGWFILDAVEALAKTSATAASR